MKVGVIGLGHWGRNYVRVLREMGMDVPALSDRDPQRLEELATRYSVSTSHVDAEMLLRDPAIDAVIIATPAASHFSLAVRALEEGKDVLVEKPITLHSEEAAFLVDLADQRERVLMVGHTFLYNDAVRKLRDLVRSPASGEVYYMTARRNHLGMIRPDVSALWDLASHDVSIAMHLLDRSPEWVSAVEGRFLREDVGDTAFLTLGFGSGRLAHIEVSWVDAHKVREMVVVTSRRRIVFNDLDLMESVRIYEKGVSTERYVRSFGEFQYLLRDGDIVSPNVQLHEPLKNLCAHFADCVAKRSEPLTSGRAGLRVVRVLEAADRSMHQRGAPIEVPA